jgi:hypothetical protein
MVKTKKPEKRCPTNPEASMNQDVNRLSEVVGRKEFAERIQLLVAV